MTEKQFRSWLKLKLKNFASAIERGRVSARGSSNYGSKILLDRLEYLYKDAKIKFIMKDIKKK